MRRTALAIMILSTTVAACGDDGTSVEEGPDATVATTTTTVVLPPTTYVIHRTGVYTGNLEETGGLSGTIEFQVADVGTGVTYAEGQVVDVDYQVTDLRIAVAMTGFACGGTTVDDTTEVVLPGPFAIDVFDVAASGSGLDVRATFGTGAAVSGTITGTIAVGDVQCPVGPIGWEGAGP